MRPGLESSGLAPSLVERSPWGHEFAKGYCSRGPFPASAAFFKLGRIQSKWSWKKSVLISAALRRRETLKPESDLIPQGGGQQVKVAL